MNLINHLLTRITKRNENIAKNDNETTTDNKMANNVKNNVDFWSKHYDTIVISPTGFPNEFDWDNTLLTEKQFLEYAENSTIQFNEKITEALNNLKYERIKNLM